MSISPDNIKRDTDIIINLFGNPKIYTANGVLREFGLKSPKICRLLAYIALNRKVTVPAREIAEAVWPEEAMESDNPGKNLRILIYTRAASLSLPRKERESGGSCKLGIVMTTEGTLADAVFCKVMDGKWRV